MSVKWVEFLVEEASMEAFLRGILPPLLGDIHFEIRTFQGKSDLLRKLPQRLQGYHQWMNEQYRIVVLIDQDEQDCQELKRQMETAARQAALPTRSQPDAEGRFLVINRIAVEELEAWYFGDWEAVRAAFPRVGATIPQQARYRQPDAIRAGTWEAFEGVMKRAGYFATGLRKIEAAQSIAPHIDADRSGSPSFQCFRDALREIATLAGTP